MKLIKIKQDYYIVIDADATKVRPNDFVYSSVTNKIVRFTDPRYFSEGTFWKATHSTNIDWNELYYIPLLEIKELIGEVDVEKKAREEILYNDQKREWWKQGYVKALEDNKDKKYTEEQLIWAIQEAYGDGKNYEFDNNEIDETVESIKKFLQSKTEWEVQFDENGKLKLK